METELRNYLKKLNKEQLESVAYNCLDHLIDIDEVRYYPDEKDSKPFWDSCGESVED